MILERHEAQVNTKFILIHGMQFPNCDPGKWSLNRQQQSCQPYDTEIKVWDYWSSWDLHLRAPKIRVLRKMVEPGGLLSMGLHSVGPDWSYLAAAAAEEKHPRNLHYRSPESLSTCVYMWSNSERPSKECLLWGCDLGDNGMNANKPVLRPQKNHSLKGGFLQP